MELENVIKLQRQNDLLFFIFSILFWLVILSWIEQTATNPTLSAILYFAASLLPLVIFKLFQSTASVPLIATQRDIPFMALLIFYGSLAIDFLTKQIIVCCSTSFTRVNLLCCILIALSALVLFGLFWLFFLREHRPRKVVLKVSPEQRATILGNSGVASSDQRLIEYLSVEDLAEHLGRNALNEISLIIISRGSSASGTESEAALLRAHLAGIPILDYQSILPEVTGHISLAEIDFTSFLLNASRKTLTRRALLGIKHLFEPTVALVLGIALLPVFVAVAVLIRLTSPGPIFYRQVRCGLLGKPFALLKFRSMRVDAEINGKPQWASLHDPRVTRAGQFLRRTRLDEIPQLWNIIRGEMSFIGPRPERPEIAEVLQRDIPKFPLRTLVKPGVTGWAQVNAGYAASAAESRLKLEYDLYYIQHMCLRLDVYILIRTLYVAFAGDKIADASARLPNLAIPT